MTFNIPLKAPKRGISPMIEHCLEEIHTACIFPKHLQRQINPWTGAPWPTFGPGVTFLDDYIVVSRVQSFVCGSGTEFATLLFPITFTHILSGGQGWSLVNGTIIPPPITTTDRTVFLRHRADQTFDFEEVKAGFGTAFQFPQPNFDVMPSIIKTDPTLSSFLGPFIQPDGSVFDSSGIVPISIGADGVWTGFYDIGNAAMGTTFDDNVQTSAGAEFRGTNEGGTFDDTFLPLRNQFTILLGGGNRGIRLALGPDEFNDPITINDTGPDLPNAFCAVWIEQ